MAAMLVASSVAMGAASLGRRDVGASCSSVATPPPQLVYLQGRKSGVSCGVVGTSSIVMCGVHARSRSTGFPLPRSTLAENPTPQKQEAYTVGDYMTPVKDLYCATVNTTIDEALEVLVEKRITGMPVVDDAGNLVGVVSDYDLLALDSISGQRQPETSLFPEAGRTWKPVGTGGGMTPHYMTRVKVQDFVSNVHKAFKEIQKLLVKTNGKAVGDVMTPSPLVVREQTNLEDAARVLLDTKFRRLPVVNENGKLVGLLTRGNVVRAALIMKRAAEEMLGGKQVAEELLGGDA